MAMISSDVIAEMKGEIERLSGEICAVKRSLSAAQPHDGFRAVQIHNAVVALTKRIFGAEPSIVQECDPEIAGEEYFVVTVAAQGAIEEIVARDCIWHAELTDVAGELSSRYRLSLDIL